MSYWTALTVKLTCEIERAGWRVVHKALGGRVVGQCDYNKRAIYLDDPDPRQEFITLCHENGHRLAFALHGCKNEAAFRRHCGLRKFRELQACVLGWHSCRKLTARVTLSEWIDFNSDCVELSVLFAGDK